MSGKECVIRNFISLFKIFLGWNLLCLTFIISLLPIFSEFILLDRKDCLHYAFIWFVSVEQIPRNTFNRTSCYGEKAFQFIFHHHSKTAHFHWTLSHFVACMTVLATAAHAWTQLTAQRLHTCSSLTLSTFYVFLP